jgi:HK97 family phage portal protein
VVRAALNLQTPLSYISGWTGAWWWPHETGTGTWQTNTATADPKTTLLTFPVVFACVTGIAQDLAKLRIKLVRFTADEIWEEVGETHGNSDETRLKALLNKPNHFQITFEFVVSWILSKLLHGNTYVLKERDSDGKVVQLYVLDPSRVTPLVSNTGDIYYQLQTDNIAGVGESVTIPARHIIHDKMPSFFWHPLIGISPLTACALSATLGNKILNNSTNFFENRAIPGGILTTPKEITKAKADELQLQFESGFGGANRGRIAVLGNDMKFTPLVMTSEQAQLAEQMGMTREDVAMVFHYPLYKLGLATPPYANGPQSAQMLYYTDCLQPLMESLERHLDEGLSIPDNLGTEMDTDGLLRMDTLGLFESIDKSGSFAKLNEQRKRAGLRSHGPAGDTVYKQEQDHSVDALYKRDQGPDPFASTKATPPTEPTPSRMLSLPAADELTLDEIAEESEMMLVTT